jgi:hypothetical protein
MSWPGLLGKGNLRGLVFDANHDTLYAQPCTHLIISPPTAFCSLS